MGEPRAEDVGFLIAAYGVRPSKDVGLLMEIVDLIGLFDSAEACDLLRRIAHAQAHAWVR